VGIIMGMGNDMGKIEIDERGRLTLPSKVRKKLGIKTGDKLTITTSSDKIILYKKPSKEIIFKELVGCIKIPSEETPTPESIKKIWKLIE
jgi:AbrB family looped-hinge helix DNA binding protein